MVTSLDGSGVLTSEARDLPPLGRVTLSCPATLALDEGAGSTIAIEAEDNILPLIETVVEERDGVSSLHIRFTDTVQSISPTLPIRMRMPFGEIAAITVSGSGTVTSVPMRSDEIELRVSGSGAIAVDRVDSRRLELTISGSGAIDIEGISREVTATVSGSGHLNAERLVTEDADIRISGSGTAHLHVDRTLRTRISGSGDLHVSGKPEIDSRITGSGQIVRVTSA